MNADHVIYLLKSALMVSSWCKNELIEEAIKEIDPIEYANMKKEFDEILNEMFIRQNSQ
jgi:hypothetical protein